MQDETRSEVRNGTIGQETVKVGNNNKAKTGKQTVKSVVNVVDNADINERERRVFSDIAKLSDGDYQSYLQINDKLHEDRMEQLRTANRWKEHQLR